MKFLGVEIEEIKTKKRDDIGISNEYKESQETIISNLRMNQKTTDFQRTRKMKFLGVEIKEVKRNREDDEFNFLGMGNFFGMEIHEAKVQVCEVHQAETNKSNNEPVVIQGKMTMRQWLRLDVKKERTKNEPTVVT